MLMENPLSGEGGSFGDSGRLYMLQSALLQQVWRVSDLVHRLVTYLTPHLGHQYKNVRDRIGSVLSDVFMMDYTMFKNSETKFPTKKAFIQSVLPKLERLQEIMIEEAQHQNEGGEANSVSISEGIENMEVENHHEDIEEKKYLIRLCKTVLKCVSSCISRTFDAASAEFFQLLPVICTLQSESKDDELKSDCMLALGLISQSLVRDDVIPVALTAIKKIVGSPSWHARAAVLEYIQVMVFCNFFTMHTSEYKNRITETVMHLICDEKLEVRDMASITFSGLLQCGYLEMNKDTLEHFETLGRIKIKKKNKTDVIPIQKIIQRHAGVLGLSAYVQAYPYNVPDWMPQILMTLSNHVNDPQPIQMTVKKTLSNFRRTHHDNWHDHKLQFTDDQLVILTDLLVSPNYYA